MQHLIVPIDGSDTAWRAFDVAVALARRCDASVEAVEVVFEADEVRAATTRLADGIDAREIGEVEYEVTVPVADVGVAASVSTLVAAHEGSVVVVASHGRGRSAALMGSIAEELLLETFGPVLVVGPEATVPDFGENIVVGVDGSEHSESVLGLAAAWAIELGVIPWIVEVIDPRERRSPEVADADYTDRLAGELATSSGHTVETEVLNHTDAAAALAEFAEGLRASMIVCATHGRTGLSRMVVGSTAANVVRHAPCPVLIQRSPHLH